MELAALHEQVADRAERMGPNIKFARTYRICAIALRQAAEDFEQVTP